MLFSCLRMGITSCIVLLIFSCNKNNKSNPSQLFSKGNYKEAIQQYTSELESYGQDPDILYNRGRCYEELGEYSHAKRDFKKVIALEKRHTNAYLSLAAIAYEEKNYPKAMLILDQLLDFNVNIEKAHFLQARSKHHLGNIKSALESYTAAIALNAEYGEAYLYRGAAKNTLNITSACQDFQKAKALGVKEALDIVNSNCK